MESISETIGLNTINTELNTPSIDEFETMVDLNDVETSPKVNNRSALRKFKAEKRHPSIIEFPFLDKQVQKIDEEINLYKGTKNYLFVAKLLIKKANLYEKTNFDKSLLANIYKEAGDFLVKSYDDTVKCRDISYEKGVSCKMVAALCYLKANVDDSIIQPLLTDSLTLGLDIYREDTKNSIDTFSSKTLFNFLSFSKQLETLKFLSWNIADKELYYSLCIEQLNYFEKIITSMIEHQATDIDHLVEMDPTLAGLPNNEICCPLGLIEDIDILIAAYLAISENAALQFEGVDSNKAKVIKNKSQQLKNHLQLDARPNYMELIKPRIEKFQEALNVINSPKDHTIEEFLQMWQDPSRIVQP